MGVPRANRWRPVGAKETCLDGTGHEGRPMSLLDVDAMCILHPVHVRTVDAIDSSQSASDACR
jgi:hypothetical protein